MAGLQNSLAGLRCWWSVDGMQRPTATAQPPATLAEDRLLRPEQAAWYLNVKTSWVYEAVRAGRLPCHRVGRHIRFTRPMLDDWLAAQPRQ
jgi:excisionase family DNA binding protein